MTRKFREKRKIPGNPVPSPFSFCSHCSRPVLSLAKPRESLCSAGSACGCSAWMCPRAHTRHAHTQICVRMYRAQTASRARTSRLLPPRSLAFPEKNRTWMRRAPRCKRSLLRSAPKQRDPSSERDFRLEDISPAVKKVEGNLSIVLDVLRV